MEAEAARSAKARHIRKRIQHLRRYVGNRNALVLEGDLAPGLGWRAVPAWRRILPAIGAVANFFFCIQRLEMTDPTNTKTYRLSFESLKSRTLSKINK
jgi:hypothetical protein